MFESCFKPWDWNFPHFAQPNFFVPLRKVRSCCSSVRFPLAEGPNIQLTQLHRSSRKIWVLPREYHQIWMIFGARLKQKTFVLPSCKGGPLNTRDKSRGTRDMMACFYGIGRQSMASIFFALEPPTGDKSCSRCVRRNCDVFLCKRHSSQETHIQWFGPACSHLRICWPAIYSRLSWILKAQWRTNTTKATETFFCDKNARQNARKYLANARNFLERPAKPEKSHSFC